MTNNNKSMHVSVVMFLPLLYHNNRRQNKQTRFTGSVSIIASNVCYSNITFLHLILNAILNSIGMTKYLNKLIFIPACLCVFACFHVKADSHLTRDSTLRFWTIFEAAKLFHPACVRYRFHWHRALLRELWIEHACMLVRCKQLSWEIAGVTHSPFLRLSFAFSSPASFIMTSEKV